MADNIDVLDAASVLKTMSTTDNAGVHTPHQLNQPLSVAMTQTAPVISNLASTQVVAAKADRKFLLIQNNDAANAVYIHFGGGAAALATGIKLGSGESYQWDSVVGNQEVNAISAVAPVTLIVVEG